MNNNRFEHYEFKGTHREVGHQYGEELRTKIKKHLELTLELAGNVSGINKKTAQDTAVLLKPYIEKYAPGFNEEIAALGEGADITPEEALILQARQEVVYLSAYGGGRGECSSYAVGPPYTKDGMVYSGQNADLAGDFESISSILSLVIENKPRIMMLLPAGQISYIGINESGMGVNCNFLSCKGWGEGFPRYLISRLLLEEKTFEDACETLIRLEKRASSRNVLISDKNGNFANFETTNSDMQLVSGNEMMVHTNHFVGDAMLQYELSDDLEMQDSTWRYDRLTELLTGGKGSIDLDLIKKYLSDKKCDKKTGKFSVCMHASEETGFYHTFASVINDLTNCAMYVTKGLPDSNEYVKYEL